MRISSNASTALRSSRPRSARAERGRRELFARLLRQGARFPGPGAEILEAAAELEALGLIQVRRAEAVFCANPDDRDFPPPDPDCAGLIELRTGADEGGGDYACPLCGRVVYPTVHEKERVDLLIAALDRNGIERFIEVRCGGLAGQRFVGGVLVLPDLPQNHFICIVDFCKDASVLASNWSETQPCVYVTVDPRARTRLAATTTAPQVELVELLDGGVALERLVRQAGPMRRAAGSAPANLLTSRSASSLARIDGGSTCIPPGRFVVDVSAGGIHVGGVVIDCDRFGLPRLSFIEIMQQFASDLASQREVLPLTAKEIAERIRRATPGATPDPGSVQKALKRLDRTIVKRLRAAGLRINEGDVIENVTRAGKYRGRHGFCLNSGKVVLGACWAEPS